MTTPASEIDEAILSVATTSWRKVALVVSQAASHVGGLPAGDAGYQMVADRIPELVSAGELIAQGDT